MRALSRLRTTKLFEPEDTELIQMSREVAVDLIIELSQDLAKTGTYRKVFRLNGGQLIVFQVKDEEAL